MKKAFLAVILIFLFLPIFSVDIELMVDADNYAYKVDGSLRGKIPDVGFNFKLQDDLTNYLRFSLDINRTAGFGNTMKPRITAYTKYLEFSFGPTISIFNVDFSKKDFLKLFQPGFGTKVAVNTPVGFFASLDVDFAIPLIKGEGAPVYLQNGDFEAGWIFPNLRASVMVSQDNQTTVESSHEIYIKKTDVALKAVAFSKPSRVKFPITVIYRMNHFNKTGATPAKKEYASVIVGGGIIHSVNADTEWFLNFAASVYSYDMATKAMMKAFLYQANVGFKISIHK